MKFNTNLNTIMLTLEINIENEIISNVCKDTGELIVLYIVYYFLTYRRLQL